MWLKILVPRAWVAEEALYAVALLHDLVTAIWAVHGDEMAAQLHDWPRERWSEVLPPMCDETDEDDIPF